MFPKLIEMLYQSVADHSEEKVIETFASYDCLCIDEMGYINVEPVQVGLFFTLMHKRHKRKSTLITSNLGFQEWATFLKEYKFLVGLSLDGPEHIHNKYRLLGNGKGSWRKVEDSARLLLDLGVEVNSLSCLTDYSARFPEEIYNYHKSLGFKWMQFIPVVETDKNISGKTLRF